MCWQTFSVEDQIVSILGFVGHMVSVATNLFCHCNAKAATDSTYMNEHGCVPIKCYFISLGTLVAGLVCQSWEEESKRSEFKSQVVLSLDM